jgi:SAM-dependent methyltransferase
MGNTTSTASGHHAYALGHSEAELERLARQSAFYADLTEDVLRRAGLAAGMRVLDVGCGAGDVSLLAAALVGAEGRVLGIDRSPQAVDTTRRRAAAAGLSNVEAVVAELDAFTADEPFDALIGRFVLMYQRDAAATLRALVRQLRPGAVVAFQEMDLHACRSFPDAPLYRQSIERVIATFERGGFEPDMGSRLYGTFLRAGLPEPTMIGASRVEGGPSSMAYSQVTAVTRSLLPAMERLGIATAAEVDLDTLEERLRAEAVGGTHCLFAPTLVGAWGKRR